MFQLIPTSKQTYFSTSKLPILALLLSTFFFIVSPIISRNSDSKFLAGYRSLFATTLTSYPFQQTYTVGFVTTLPSVSTYYDLVVSINTFNFLESNTIGWNFTKSGLTLSKFDLKYEAGINSILYQLAINYMVIDNSYQDVQIAYFNYKCLTMSQNADFRSQNISYTLKKFSNDSNYTKSVFIESFNISNTENDNIGVKYTSYQINLTTIIQFFVTGLSKLYEIQFYIVFHNVAQMLDRYERVVLTELYTIAPATVMTTLDAQIKTYFKYQERFFSGLSGFNVTKPGSKKFEFLLYSSMTAGFSCQFTVSGGGFVNVDYSIFALYVPQCTSGEVFRPFLDDCIASCPATQFPDSTYSMPFCKGCHYTCSIVTGCWDQKDTSCKSCSGVNRNQVQTGVVGANIYYSCPCDNGYFDVWKANCQPCINYLAGCSKCANNATCLACLSGHVLINNKCYCSNPTQVSISGVCVNRLIGCQTHIWNSTRYICTQCYVQRNFTLNPSFQCQCQKPSYQFVQDVTGNGEYWCNYICGDGYRGDGEECDDGNLNAYDGCSDKCKVQSNFSCSGVVGAVSVCKYNLSTEFMFHWSQRVLYENTAVLNFTFEPYFKYMGEIANWSAFVVTTLPVEKIQHDFICPNLYESLRCNLTLTVRYTDHIEGSYFSMYVRLSDHPKIRYDSRPCYFKPIGNLAMLSYQPQSHLNLIETMNTIMLVLTILSLLIFLISIKIQKMIGIELIMSVQFIYFLLTPVAHNPIELVALEKNLKFSTGYNMVTNYTYGRYAPLPIFLNHQYYQKEFLLNMNVMLLILVLVMLLLISVKLIKACQEKCRKGPNKEELFDNEDQSQKKTFDKFYNLYWNKIFFVSVFFVMYQVLFGCVITTSPQNPLQTIFSASLNFLAAFLSFFIMICGILSVGYWFYQGSRKKGHLLMANSQIIPYQFPLCKKQYILLYVAVQPIKIWTLAIFYSQSYCYYAIISICFIYFIVIAVLRPYIRNEEYSISSDNQQQEDNYVCLSIHNFGIGFNEFMVMGFTVMMILWQNMSKEPNYDSEFPQFMLYMAIAIIFLLDVVAILRLFYKKLGRLLCCEYFKNSNPNTFNFENAYAKMRKVVREDDKQQPDDYAGPEGQNVQNADKNVSKNRKMKILQDVKKAKNFMVNWKDDPKPKYYDFGFSDQISEHPEQQQQKQQQSPQPSTQQKPEPSPLMQSQFDAYFKQQQMSQSKYRNVGIVQMKTLMKGLNQSTYLVNKSSSKKTAQLNKSVVQTLLQKKELEMSASKINKSIYVDQGEKPQRQLTQQQVKDRLRMELQMKRNQKEHKQVDQTRID